MKLTKDWITKQISDYKQMLRSLTTNEDDKKLYLIWKERVNTLESVLTVLELESKAA